MKKFFGSVLIVVLAVGFLGVSATVGPISAQVLSWDFECHTQSHPWLDRLTDSEIRAQYEMVNAAFVAHGLAIPKHTAYPGGRLDHKGRVVAVTSEYRLTGRVVYGEYNTWPWSDWYHLQAAQLKKNTSNNTMKSWIDTAVADGSWLVVLSHDVKANPTIYGCTPEQLAYFLDYAVQKQNEGALQILTLADAYDVWSGSTQPKATVTFTFDDGWVTDYENVYPMFKQRNIAGTSYIITGAIENAAWDDTAQRLTWSMVGTMANWL